MGTASFEFLGFALCVVIVFNLFGAVAWRQFILLAASLVFLTFFSTSLLAWVPFTAFLAGGYASLRLLQNGVGARAYLPMVIACIAVFVWLKKYAFIPSGLFLHYPYVTVGLSYIFFRMLHLLIDAHAGQIAERVSPASYLNYTLNFTTLLSGPIQTYQGFAAYQLAPAALRLDVFDAGQALERILVGFFKVNVLSLTLSMMQTEALTTLHTADPFGTRVLHGMLIVAIYPLYLYCNFSGYIDMVIGIARFLRIELPENFNRPFSATNFMMCWSRWHITLSQWLRTYVYNTLLIASMRRFQGAAIAPYLSVFAIFVTFFLVGLWHGQTAEFLFFGLLQGGGVGAVQLYQTVMTKRLGKKRFRALSANALYLALCRGLTFAWFAFTLLWFWSDWTQIGELTAKLGPAAAALTGVGMVLAATLILTLWETLRASVLGVRAGGQPLLASRYCRVAIGTAVAVISIATVALVNAPAPDLVYKAF
jgi:D-alanyl-lipoteichoic acid acyltransferase DltB (MBOAT superfamily)